MVTKRKSHLPANIAAFAFLCLLILLGLRLVTGRLDPFASLISGPAASDYFANNPKSQTFQWSDQSLENWKIRFFEPNSAKPLWQLYGRKAWPDGQSQFQFEDVVIDVSHNLSLSKSQSKSQPKSTLRLSSQRGSARFVGKEQLILHFGRSNSPVMIVSGALTFSAPSAELTVPLQPNSQKAKTNPNSTQQNLKADNLASRLTSTQFDPSEISLKTTGPVKGHFKLDKIQNPTTNSFQFAKALTMTATSLHSKGLNQLTMTGPVIVKIPQFQSNNSAQTPTSKTYSKIPDWTKVGLKLEAGQLNAELIYASKTEHKAYRSEPGNKTKRPETAKPEATKSKPLIPEPGKQNSKPELNLLRFCRIKLSQSVKFCNFTKSVSGTCGELQVDLIPEVHSSKLHSFLGSAAVAALESLRNWNQLGFERLILQTNVHLEMPTNIERKSEIVQSQQQLLCQLLKLDNLKQDLLIVGHPFYYRDSQSLKRNSKGLTTKVFRRQQRQISGGQLLYQKSQRHFVIENHWSFSLKTSDSQKDHDSELLATGQRAQGNFIAKAHENASKSKVHLADLAQLQLLGSPVNFNYQAHSKEKNNSKASKSQSLKMTGESEVIHWRRSGHKIIFKDNVNLQFEQSQKHPEKDQQTQSKTEASGESLTISLNNDLKSLLTKTPAKDDRNTSDSLANIQKIEFLGEPSWVKLTSGKLHLNGAANRTQYWPKLRKIDLQNKANVNFVISEQDDSISRTQTAQNFTLKAQRIAAILTREFLSRLQSSQTDKKTQKLQKIQQKPRKNNPGALFEWSLTSYFESLNVSRSPQRPLTLRIDSPQSLTQFTGDQLNLSGPRLTLQKSPLQSLKSIEAIQRSNAVTTNQCWPLLHLQSKAKSTSTTATTNQKAQQATQNHKAAFNAQLFGERLNWNSKLNDLTVTKRNLSLTPHKASPKTPKKNSEKASDIKASGKVYGQLYDQNFDEAGFFESDQWHAKKLNSQKAIALTLTGRVVGQFKAAALNRQGHKAGSIKSTTPIKSQASDPGGAPWAFDFAAEQAKFVSQYSSKRKTWGLRSARLESQKSVVTLRGHTNPWIKESPAHKKKRQKIQNFLLTAQFLKLTDLDFVAQGASEPCYLLTSKLSRQIKPKIETDKGDLLTADNLALRFFRTKPGQPKSKPTHNASINNISSKKAKTELSRAKLDLETKALVRLVQVSTRRQKTTKLVTTIQADHLDAELNLLEMPQRSDEERWRSLNELNAKGQLLVTSRSTKSNTRRKNIDEQRTIKGQSLRYTRKSQKAEILGRPVRIKNTDAKGSTQVVELPKTTIRLPGTKSKPK